MDDPQVLFDQCFLAIDELGDGVELIEIQEIPPTIPPTTVDSNSLHMSVNSADHSVYDCDDVNDADYVPSHHSSDDSSESESNITQSIGNSNSVDAAVILQKKGRKRVRCVSNWKRNIRKKHRSEGLAYVNSKGKKVPDKQPAPVNCDKCRFHCSEKLDEEARLEQCKYFYSIDNKRKKDFICRLVLTSTVDRRRRGRGIRPKSVSRYYYLPTADGDKRVCQKFFCTTLGISKKTVDYAVAHKNELGLCELPEHTGRVPSNKTSSIREQLVHEHIKSFPLVESHYCRANSTALYLNPGLNISELYRLYRTDFCVRNNISDPVTKGVYRRIFVSDFNIRFFIPKKDQCSTCNAYYEANEQDKVALKPDFDNHKRREKEAMEMKEADKSASKADLSLVSITFDLQAVLQIPHAGDAQIYYLRKLSAYNFTIYETASHNGFCYAWNETDGNRGANEIATCLSNYISSLPPTVKHIRTFSDTCGGQNRNQFMCAAMLHVVKTTHIEQVDLKYMESGHSYLEVDSMHSTIERNKRHQKIYTQRELELVISTARKSPSPYVVKRMTYQEFMDFKELSKKTIVNRTRNSLGETIRWLKIKQLRFEKAKPDLIQYKYDLSDDFKELIVRPARRGRKSVDNLELKPVYDARLPISSAKKKDLLKLIKDRVIPPEYEEWYNNLPVSENANDRLPAPSADEPEPIDGETEA